MVRIKHRYLLFNILYPTATTSTASTATPSYLNFHIPTPAHVNASVLSRHLRSHITLLFGDHGLGVSLSSLKFIYFSSATSTAILRVPRNHFRIVWASLTYMTELPAEKGGTKSLSCVVRVVRVSGTIKKAEEELLRRSRQEVVRAKLLQENTQMNSLAGLLKPPRTIAVTQTVPLTYMEDGIEDHSEDEDMETD